MTTLRDYQVRMNTAAQDFLQQADDQRAQIYAPTGAGKTVCFTELIKWAIQNGKRNIAVIHPRLALSQDQLTRFKSDFGTSAHFTSFHSGNHVNGAETTREVSTIDLASLVKIITSASTVLGKPHITFTTYNSYAKLTDQKFDVIICDEAHYLVQDQFSEYLGNMNADKILFYTATPICEELEGSGMMNFDLFGKVIAQVTPSELILGGYIVPPLVEMLDCTTNKKADRPSIIDIVSIAYVNQHKEVTSWGMKNHQMLVACRDVAIDIGEQINNKIREIRAGITARSNGVIDGDTVDIYTVSSGSTYKNGSPMSGGNNARKDAIDEIKKNGSNAIVAHYDTLSEGIDISTLTGALIMRDMTKSKLIQTIGRPARPSTNDLDSNFNPRPELFNIKEGFDIRQKRRSIITFPIVDGKWLSGIGSKEVAEAFIAGGYGDLMTYMAKPEFKPTGKGDGPDGDDEPTWLADIKTNSSELALVDLRKLFVFDDEEETV